jgi:gluconokinase
MIADAIGYPLRWSPESEATSRGVALLALQSLGMLDDFAHARRPLGDTVAPDPARHARYRAALERQRGLDEKV